MKCKLCGAKIDDDSCCCENCGCEFYDEKEIYDILQTNPVLLENIRKFLKYQIFTLIFSIVMRLFSFLSENFIFFETNSCLKIIFPSLWFLSIAIYIILIILLITSIKKYKSEAKKTNMRFYL